MVRCAIGLRRFGIVIAAMSVGLATGCVGGPARPLIGGGNSGGSQVLDGGGAAAPLFGNGAAPIFASAPNRPLFGGPSKPIIRPASKAEEVDELSLPKELNKVTMPPYTVEAPDILLIDAQRLIPLPPYRVKPLDVLYLFVPGTPDSNPINGPYPVDTDGTINLGGNYGGSVKVADMTVPEIEKMLQKYLEKSLKAEVAKGATVSLAQTGGLQQVRGDHLVRPDGTVSLGNYGSVYVAGMTLPQIKAAIEQQLSKELYKPEVSVDVYAYNSKFYYVITDFAGSGEQVVRLPSTGNETVLDAISMIGGLSAVSSKRLWIARPAPAGVGCGDQILPVDWRGITRRGQTKTNYQILPGDRVFVMSQPLSKFDTQMARVIAPAERALGATLFGYTTGRTLSTGGNNLFGNNSGTTVNVAR